MLVVTCGDPYSINAEGLLAMLNQPVMQTFLEHNPCVIVGDQWQLHHQWQQLQQMPSLQTIDRFQAMGAKGLHLLVTSCTPTPAHQLTELQRGEIATKPLYALQDLMDIDQHPGIAVVTLPIDKNACRLAGFDFPGQTEYFGQLWSGEPIMTMVGQRLVVGLMTHHLSIAQVPARLNKEFISQRLQIFQQSLAALVAKSQPRVAVCGLNPHCGEKGMFGSEEMDVIEPAIHQLQHLGYPVFGPYPADSVFYRCLQGEFDGVMAMYHDQGLAPFKTVEGWKGVNLSLGLSNFRCSPDHGTGADLYLTGRADTGSYLACARLAIKYTIL